MKDELITILTDRLEKCTAALLAEHAKVQRLEADARRYRWLAADGDRARALLNTYSGNDVEYEIDAAIDTNEQPPKS